MSLVFRPEQYSALEAQRLRDFAAEVVRILAPVVADLPEVPPQRTTEPFVLAQLEEADTHGLKRRNELVAWTLCAMVHGPDFAWRMPQVRAILDDRNYDRSVLFTLLATQGLTSEVAA